MSDLLNRQDVIEAFWKLDIELRPSAIDAITDMLKTLPSAEPEIIRCKDCKNYEQEERPLTEDDYAYCVECDHGEMCRWYPMYGCEFKSRPSVEPEQFKSCKNCIHLGHAYMMPCKNCRRNQMMPDWYEVETERRTDE